METLLLGIDDAGRGPVIGSMVLAGCLIDEAVALEFKQLGVRDSKQLTQKRREFLEKIIKEKSKRFWVEILSPEEIDSKNGEGINLNDLEAIMASKIINELNKNPASNAAKTSNAGGAKIKVIIDCPSPNKTKWRDNVRLKINNLSNLDVICEHKADRDYVVVSAASILAKCEREREMAKLKAQYGKDIGSGYSSDPITKKFLAKNIKKHNHSGIFRKTWSTWKKTNHNLGQKKLF